MEMARAMTPHQKQKTLGSSIFNPPLKLLQGKMQASATVHLAKAFGGICLASQNKTTKTLFLTGQQTLASKLSNFKYIHGGRARLALRRFVAGCLCEKVRALKIFAFGYGLGGGRLHSLPGMETRSPGLALASIRFALSGTCERITLSPRPCGP